MGERENDCGKPKVTRRTIVDDTGMVTRETTVTIDLGGDAEAQIDWLVDALAARQKGGDA